jgi:hypothetical protein
MRVLVFGGRNYRNVERVFAVLDALEHRPTVIIEGGAPGADSFAKQWAQARGIPFEEYEAKWKDLNAPGAVIRYRRTGGAYNVLAGFDRNQKMIDEGKPDAAVEFPGRNGTADMARRLAKAGIPIYRSEW